MDSPCFKENQMCQILVLQIQGDLHSTNLSKIEGQLVTKAICNKGFSGKSLIHYRLNFSVSRQESSPQSLTAYSLSR